MAGLVACLLFVCFGLVLGGLVIGDRSGVGNSNILLWATFHGLIRRQNSYFKQLIDTHVFHHHTPLNKRTGYVCCSHCVRDKHHRPGRRRGQQQQFSVLADYWRVYFYWSRFVHTGCRPVVRHARSGNIKSRALMCFLVAVFTLAVVLCQGMYVVGPLSPVH